MQVLQFPIGERIVCPSMTGPRPYIIVVDDDGELRELMADFLREQDMEVATAADAAELDEMLAKRRADLIVLDIMMPGESGLSVVQRLVGPVRPGIVMLSAMGDDIDRIEGLDLGADDYLVKPCNPRELLRPGSGRVAQTQRTPRRPARTPPPLWRLRDRLGQPAARSRWPQHCSADRCRIPRLVGNAGFAADRPVARSPD